MGNIEKVLEVSIVFTLMIYIFQNRSQWLISGYVKFAVRLLMHWYRSVMNAAEMNG